MFFVVVVVVVVLFVKKNFFRPVLSCFINFIFNSFVISYWMYFVVIERKKNLKKKEIEILVQNVSKSCVISFPSK